MASLENGWKERPVGPEGGYYGLHKSNLLNSPRTNKEPRVDALCTRLVEPESLMRMEYATH
jgi:hypothetical protein